MKTTINSDGEAVVSYDLHWKPIDESTPRGVKMLLISQKYGITSVGIHISNDKYFTHWHPLPTFKKDTK